MFSFIRNNLTIIEALRLTGEGVIASLKFGNRKPGSSTPLFFDITEKHLKDCDRDKNKKVTAPPNFTVKRTFVARNTGVIPVKVTRFFINNIECEGYGFRVLNCESFELLPNGTHKVDIAFTPDFTLTKVQRLLILETSLNEYVNYTLVSSIPVSLASKCAAILRRPTWEITLHNLTSTLLIGIGFCVLFAGCYESYKILTFMSVSCVRDPNMVHTPFDLRAIGRMDMNKKSEAWDCCPHSSESKSKEPSNYKVSNWNFNENVYADESKSNNHNNKYEDVNQNTNIRNRKKLNKRNSNASDTANELNIDQELPLKEKKIVKEPVTNSSWKSFTRNSMMSALKQNQINSKSNLNDTSEQQKSHINNVTETVNTEKPNKLQEVPKKVSNTFNAVNETPDSNNQTNYTNNKKHNKLKCVSPQSHSCEEDTSSTTTESSNNGDADKENDNSTSSSNKSVASNNSKKTGSAPNNKKGKCTVQKDSYEGDGEDEEYDNKSQNHHNPTHTEVNPRWTKNKEHSTNSHNAKSNSETEKQKTFEHNKNSNHSSYEHTNPATKVNKKDNSKSNQKRDRQVLSKKRSLDKSFVFISKSDNTNNLHTTNSLSIARSSPSTPPAISTVWENRASFSDVVARSEHSYSTNFVNHPKEIQDSRKSEPKPSVTHGSSNQSHNTIKYSTDENRKSEPPIKQTSDLGPIGSNFYSKKPSWSESAPDNQVKQFVSNVQVNSHPQNISEDIHSVNNNSYFLNSAYYKNIADLTPKSNMNISNHGNTTPVNYGSIGSMNNIGNSNISRMQFNIGAAPVMQNLNESNMNMQSNQLNMNSYEPCVHHNNYGLRLSPVGCNALEIPSSSDLLDLATNSNMSMLNPGSPQISSIDGFDPQINPWDRVSNDIMGHVNNMSGMNNDMFDVDYNNTRNFYEGLYFGNIVVFSFKCTINGVCNSQITKWVGTLLKICGTLRQ